MQFIVLATRGQQEVIFMKQLIVFSLSGSIEFIHKYMGNLGKDYVSAFYSNVLIFLMEKKSESHKPQVASLGSDIRNH